MTAGDALYALSLRAGRALGARGLTLATAESCTGGWVAKALTDVAGSSEWFGWGFVPYSNEAKLAALQVPAPLLAEHGAVSEAVVRQMAAGARAASGAQVALAVSGIAGPGGGSDAKPVGTVWFAWLGPFGDVTAARRFDGGRDAVRRQAVAHALERLAALLEADAGA